LPVFGRPRVDGESLHTFVERHLHNPQVLLNLATEWRALLSRLHAFRLAHGDLQHDNVRVTPQGQLRLIDYDGMFVPPLRGELGTEGGHENFQHPLRTIHDYYEDLDNFSALVIYTSLLALVALPDLWQQHHTGENLIFSDTDYKTPEQSVLLQQMKQSTNSEVQKLAVQVEQCCRGTLAQVPKLEEVIAAQHIQQRLVSRILPLELRSLVFYESGRAYTEEEQRRYSTYFPQSIARYIKFELNTSNLLYTQQDRAFQLVQHYYKPDGRLMGWDQKITWVIPSDYDQPQYTSGWGWDNPGRWTPGIYRVVILIDEVEFAEGSFGIIHSLNGWNSNLELESLRFYEGGRDFVEEEQRRYSTYFPQSIARYIKFEITVRNYYKLLDSVYQLKWRYYNSTGNLGWEEQAEWNIKADWSRCWYSRGYGSNTPGRLEPGIYRVEILIDGVEFAYGSFTIEHS
jgi:hypothetical protein